MTSQPKLVKLFEPIRIGKLEIKNRIVMPAMANALATEDGYVNDQLLTYFEARARGGAGLITVGFTCIDFPRGTEGPRRLAIDHDKYLPGLTSLTQTIKKHGARVAIQLNHAGGAALHSLTGFQPIAPSPIICRPGGDVCRALTIDEIGEMVQFFVRAAERAVKAGFEAIEIHAATGYLLNEFLSPYYNRRKDSYGGSLENRARFLMEVVRAVRDMVGRDYPLLVRLNGREYIGNAGITIEHTCQLAPMLEREGVNAINVTQYGFIYPFAKTEEPPGAYLYLAEAVKKAVNIPVIAVGRITPEVGERSLLEGKADLVAIARGLLADPELPRKASEGRLDDIVPCITCLTCGALSLMGMAGCSVNPSVGKEREHQLAPAQKPKRVLVVGGGPAGMETARVAALRGHRVTIYEKEARLGGRLRPRWSLRLATRLIQETNVPLLTEYLARQMKKAGVEVRLGEKVTAAMIRGMKPDALVLATGGKLSLLRRLAEMTAAMVVFFRYRDALKKDWILRDRAERIQLVGPHTVMLAASRPDLDLLKEIGGAVPEVHVVGDCREPFGIMSAMADGARVGRAL